MKNPLNKRFLRELRSEIGKYLVIFILLVGTIGFVSGYLVAARSMIVAYDESFTKYNMEDGNFVLEKNANKYLRDEIESQGVTLYENYYVEEALTNGTTMRIFSDRKEVNLPCVMEGELPDSADEIAIDRMYADNNELQVGDPLTVRLTAKDGTTKEGKTYTICGFVALPDYSTLFSDNSDMMFDAMMFGVGVVTEEAFAAFDRDMLVYDYVWQYNDTSAHEMDDAVEQDVTEELMKFINSRASLKKFIPQSGDYFHGGRPGRRQSHDDRPSVYHHCDHGVRLRGHDVEHDHQGGQCHRHTPGIRLHKGRTHPALYDNAGHCHAHKRRHRQHSGLYVL